MILDKNAAVARFTNQSNPNKEAYVAVDGLGNIQINIQPASDELIAITDGAVGSTFLAFTSVSGIMVGDQITVSGTGDIYIVKGIRDWYFQPIPHLELVLFKGDN